MRHLIFGDVRFCFSTHKDTILAESKRESEGETVTNFVIIVNMPLSPVPSSSRRGTSPETRFSIQSLAPPPPHNQSNFKVASVRKAQNVASLATQLVHPFSSWFFFFSSFFCSHSPSFFRGFFVGTSFLTPAFRYVSRLPFHLASPLASSFCHVYQCRADCPGCRLSAGKCEFITRARTHIPRPAPRHSPFFFSPLRMSGCRH